MSKPQYDDAPTGWTLACQSGSPLSPPDDPPLRVPVGNVMVPPSFTLVVQPDKAVTGSQGAIALTYLVRNEEIVLFMIMAIGGELPQALDILRKERPMEWWKRYAFMRQVFDVTTNEAVLIHYGPPLENAWDTAMAQTLREALHTPITSRRKRLTDSHLAKVAEAYRVAWQDGSPPTKAVAQTFTVSHSTAARWVGAARKAGHLGPTDSSRGGEQPQPKQPTKRGKS